MASGAQRFLFTSSLLIDLGQVLIARLGSTAGVTKNGPKSFCTQGDWDYDSEVVRPNYLARSYLDDGEMERLDLTRSGRVRK